MTALNKSALAHIRKYPAFMEMEKLFPSGIPDKLKEGLTEKMQLWEKVGSVIASGPESIALSDNQGNQAQICMGTNSFVLSHLSIIKEGKVVFRSEYENETSCLTEAFNCGFTTLFSNNSSH